MSDIECPECSFVFEADTHKVEVHTGSPIFFNERSYIATQCPYCRYQYELEDITADQFILDKLTQMFHRPDIGNDPDAPED